MKEENLRAEIMSYVWNKRNIWLYGTKTVYHEDKKTTISMIFNSQAKTGRITEMTTQVDDKNLRTPFKMGMYFAPEGNDLGTDICRIVLPMFKDIPEKFKRDIESYTWHREGDIITGVKEVDTIQETSTLIFTINTKQIEGKLIKNYPEVPEKNQKYRENVIVLDVKKPNNKLIYEVINHIKNLKLYKIYF